MFLHLGQNEIVPSRRVIGIFDLDKCSYSNLSAVMNGKCVTYEFWEDSRTS